MEEHTRDGFFLELQSMGITPQMALDILRRNGVKGKYEVAKHDTYIKMIKDYKACMARLMEKVNHIESAYHLLDACPICGAEVQRDSKRDGTLGELVAWKCMNPDQGKVSHFIVHRLERIRPWMQRNQGMSDPEMSSETGNEIEYLSGESLAVTSSVDYLE